MDNASTNSQMGHEIELLIPLCKQFKAVVNFAQPNLRELGYNFTVLNIEVLTQWNSTFHMIQWAIELCQSCDHFCNKNAEYDEASSSPQQSDLNSMCIRVPQLKQSSPNIYCPNQAPQKSSTWTLRPSPTDTAGVGTL
ncbi:uncharacterized protein VP01_1090g1 [Puccinia sorghi]|uniref:Uncharacterized protein n=1 Tax=Puccinia sorghi TaxID=27349 RepID=A0A0L6VT42_9BASI|nr:uncharacterized protein VP01_1090g1 [Puccinia sorghi]